jgi:hypothetical protein
MMFDGSDVDEKAKAAIADAVCAAAQVLATQDPPLDGRATIQAALLMIALALEPYEMNDRMDRARMVARAVIQQPRLTIGMRLRLVKS